VRRLLPSAGNEFAAIAETHGAVHWREVTWENKDQHLYLYRIDCSDSSEHGNDHWPQQIDVSIQGTLLIPRGSSLLPNHGRSIAALCVGVQKLLAS
jgi:hypothetical protein